MVSRQERESIRTNTNDRRGRSADGMAGEGAAGGDARARRKMVGALDRGRLHTSQDECSEARWVKSRARPSASSVFGSAAGIWSPVCGGHRNGGALHLYSSDTGA